MTLEICIGAGFFLSKICVPFALQRDDDEINALEAQTGFVVIIITMITCSIAFVFFIGGLIEKKCCC